MARTPSRGFGGHHSLSLQSCAKRVAACVWSCTQTRAHVLLHQGLNTENTRQVCVFAACFVQCQLASTNRGYPEIQRLSVSGRRRDTFCREGRADGV